VGYILLFLQIRCRETDEVIPYGYQYAAAPKTHSMAASQALKCLPYNNQVDCDFISKANLLLIENILHLYVNLPLSPG
jgi:hypothetical protein